MQDGNKQTTVTVLIAKMETISEAGPNQYESLGKANSYNLPTNSSNMRKDKTGEQIKFRKDLSHDLSKTEKRKPKQQSDHVK